MHSMASLCAAFSSHLLALAAVAIAAAAADDEDVAAADVCQLLYDDYLANFSVGPALICVKFRK